MKIGCRFFFFFPNVGKNSRYFVGVLNKTLNAPCWLSIISYPAGTSEIIVKYGTTESSGQIVEFHVEIHKEIALQILVIFPF